MARATKAAKVVEAPPTIRAIKGFDADLKCRDFQFTLGETFTHTGKVKACEGGFHAISGHPLAVFNYYPPSGSRFCLVDLSGETDSDGGEKTAASILTVGREIGISGLVEEAIAWVLARSHPEGEAATGDQGAASATGVRGAASATGYQGAASATGDQGAASATGVRGAASATGYQGAASATGDQGAASATGVQGAASATGVRGAASATGDQGAASATGVRGAASATGDQGAASATGYQGAAFATGDQGAASATGVQGAAMASGYLGAVSGALGNALFAVERASWNGPIISVASGIVGQDGIEPNVQYRAVGGKLVAVS